MGSRDRPHPYLSYLSSAAAGQQPRAATDALVWCTQADMGHYPALLAVQPETRQLQVPFIAMFYLSHARRWYAASL